MVFTSISLMLPPLDWDSVVAGLVTAQPEQTIGEIMTREAAFVHTDTDQEESSKGNPAL